MNICAKFGFENDIKYNPIKSICMVIKPRGFHLKCPDIYTNNNKLVFVEKTKYLGVVICNDWEDDEDMLRQLYYFYARFNSIIRTLSEHYPNMSQLFHRC